MSFRLWTLKGFDQIVLYQNIFFRYLHKYLRYTFTYVRSANIISNSVVFLCCHSQCTEHTAIDLCVQSTQCECVSEEIMIKDAGEAAARLVGSQ